MNGYSVSAEPTFVNIKNSLPFTDKSGFQENQNENKTYDNEGL